MPLVFAPGQLTRRAHFYEQLGQLTAAGVPILNTLEMLQRSPPDHTFVPRIRALQTAITQGATFTEALKGLGDWTPAFDIALIEAGEKSGRLDVVCRLIATYYEERAKMIRQMLTDLMYPAFVLHFAIFLFPLISLFQTFNFVAYAFKVLVVLIPLYAAIGWLIYATQDRRSLKWRAKLEKLLRPVPVFGKARQSLALARLSAALDALLDAGVNIIQAWDLAVEAAGSPALCAAVAEWKPRVVAGETPSQAVKSSPLFPELFGNLYTTGELSGQLDESLKRLHEYYQEDGTRKMHLLALWVPRLIYFAVLLLGAYEVITIFYQSDIAPLKDIMK